MDVVTNPSTNRTGMVKPAALMLALAAGFAQAAGDGPPDPVKHVIDHATGIFENPWLWTSAMSSLLLVLFILLVGGWWVSTKVMTGAEDEGHERYVTRNPFAHMVEVIMLYLRDEIVEPLLHDRTKKFMPFLWTLFFLILLCNLVGLVPFIDLQTLVGSKEMKDAHYAYIGGTPTQSIYLTAVLALIAGVVINGAGIARLGLGGYLHHLTAGAPWYVWPLMIPIEIVGIFIKPVALAIRLFANMTAGHIMLAQILIFAGTGLVMVLEGAGIGVPILAAALFGGVAIFFLEIFVGVLQAFIFMFLTTVFISLLDHHDEEHDGEHEMVETPDPVHYAEEDGALPVGASPTPA